MADKMGDFNGDGKFGLGDVITLVLGGVFGYIGLYLFGLFGVVATPDYVSGIITGMIVVLMVGVMQMIGVSGMIGKMIGGGGK